MFKLATSSACFLCMFLLSAATAQAQTQAVLVYPPDQSQDVDPYISFQWTAVSNVDAYYLYVGTQPGAKDAYDSGETLQTSLVVPNLNFNTQYFARLWTKLAGVWRYADSSFTTGKGIAHLLSPLPDATNVSPSAPMSWSAIPGVSVYYLYLGSSLGAKDVLDSGEITVTQLVPTGLQPSRQYFARLWTEIGARWYYTDSTFTTGTGIAHLLTPASGATAVDPLAPFSWTAIPDAACYYLYVGSAPALKDIYDSGEVQVTKLAVPGLAANQTYYARLWTKKGTRWYFEDDVFHTQAGVAHLVVPGDGSTDVDLNTGFSWSAVPGAQTYYVYVGTSVGAKNVYNSGEVQVTSVMVPGLEPGQTYYVRLWTKTSNQWHYVDSQFTTGQIQALFSYPSDGGSGVDPFQPFMWSGVPGAAGYFIYIGTSPGGKDVYTSDQLPASATSRLVWGLLPNRQYYARLWTLKNNTWYYNDISFQTAAPPAPLSQSQLYATVQQLTASVRESGDATTDIPTAGSPLAAEVALWQRQSATCVDYANTLLQLLAQNHIYGRRQTVTLVGNYGVSHTTAEYYDPNTNEWIVADPTFGIVFYDEQTQTGKSAAALSDIVQRQAWNEVPYKFATSSGSYYANTEFMDPITLYLYVQPQGGNLSGDLPVSPLPYLNLVPASQYGTQGFYVFSIPDGTSGLTLVDPAGQYSVSSFSRNLNLTQEDGTSWSTAFTLNDGWQIQGASSSGVQVYTFRRFLF